MGAASMMLMARMGAALLVVVALLSSLSGGGGHGHAAPSEEEAMLPSLSSGGGGHGHAAPAEEEALLPSLSGGGGHGHDHAAPAEEEALLLSRLSLSGDVGGNGHAVEEQAPAAAAAAGSMPRWVEARLRRLLRTRRNKADAVVSKDGRPGHYATIGEALAAAPALAPPAPGAAPSARRRYVVHVRAGTYQEVVKVERSDVTLMGDGMGRTVITGNRSKKTGHDTPSSAIVNKSSFSIGALANNGFMARDLTIQNTAGVAAGQAVAFLSTSNKSVCYHCDLDGFQDTLNADANLQFYHSCNISGTVDFVFGYAKAVFQECNLIVRRPHEGGHCVVTAQGRNQPKDTSGFVFQDCAVTEMMGAGLHDHNVPVFLGRPWKSHSHVVFMRTFLDAIVHPSGWEKWNDSVPVPDTVFYGEFENRGPGANTTERIKWAGFHVINDSVAAGYTVRNFIQGDEWLPEFGIKYKPGLE